MNIFEGFVLSLFYISASASAIMLTAFGAYRLTGGRQYKRALAEPAVGFVALFMLSFIIYMVIK